METHLRAFVRDLIKRENGPVHTGTIVHVFTNIGNEIPGAYPEERRALTRKILAHDDGLFHNPEHDTWFIAS